VQLIKPCHQNLQHKYFYFWGNLIPFRLKLCLILRWQIRDKCCSWMLSSVIKFAKISWVQVKQRMRSPLTPTYFPLPLCFRCDVSAPIWRYHVTSRRGGWVRQKRNGNSAALAENIYVILPRAKFHSICDTKNVLIFVKTVLIFNIMNDRFTEKLQLCVMYHLFRVLSNSSRKSFLFSRILI